MMRLPGSRSGHSWVIAMTFALLLAPGAAKAQSGGKPPPDAAPVAPAADQPPNLPEQPSPSWSVTCENTGKGLECRASLTIVMTKTRQLLLAVSVNKSAGGKDGTMLIQLPLGLFNPAGVTLSVDDQKGEALQIQTCDAKGCYAGTPITPDLLAALSKGTKLNVVFQDLKKQNITVPVPLKGFEDAYKKL